MKWKCKAALPEELKFGLIKVNCEGYENKDDPIILVGSCGVSLNVHFKPLV